MLNFGIVSMVLSAQREHMRILQLWDARANAPMILGLVILQLIFVCKCVLLLLILTHRVATVLKHAAIVNLLIGKTTELVLINVPLIQFLCMELVLQNAFLLFSVGLLSLCSVQIELKGVKLVQVLFFLEMDSAANALLVVPLLTMVT